jgi:hypothetical protein
LNGVLIAAFIETFTIPAFGAISDKLGRRPVYIFGAVFYALMSFPLFMLLGTKSPQLGWIAIVLDLQEASRCSLHTERRADLETGSSFFRQNSCVRENFPPYRCQYSGRRTP